MKIKFWGVRGSIPSPGPGTVRYGGNTSCIEVQITDKYSVVIDAGSGMRMLGMSCLSRMPIQMGIFVTHTHWDHIQGFPFFIPAFVPGNKINFFGARKVNYDLEATLKGQQEYNNFPVELMDMKSQIMFSEIEEGQRVEVYEDSEGNIAYSIGDPIDVAKRICTVTSAKLNHPYPGVFGYRIEDEKGRSVVVATDTEHYSTVHPPLVNLAKDADVIIYDCQYSEEQYEKGANLGWGHSTPEEGIKVAKAASVKKLVMFHYDPNSTDDMVDAMLAGAQEKCVGSDLVVVAASEGLEIDLEGE